MNSIRMYISFNIFVAVLLPVTMAGADTNQADYPARTMTYSISSDGDTIGSITSRHFYLPRGDQLLLRVEENTKIKVEELLSSFSYNNRSVMKYDQQGLLYFDHNISLDDVQIRVSGKRKGKQILITVKGLSAEEISTDNGPTSIPLTADGHGILNVEAFGITTQTLHHIALQAENKPRHMKVFDTEELEISQADIEWGEKVKIEAGGLFFNSYTIKVKTATSSDILYVAIEDGKPLLVMLEGRDEEEGDYVVKLVGYQRNEKTSP